MIERSPSPGGSAANIGERADFSRGGRALAA